MSGEDDTDYSLLLQKVAQEICTQKQLNADISAILDSSEEIEVLREYAQSVSEEDACLHSMTLS